MRNGVIGSTADSDKNILDELGVEYQSGTGASVSKGETVAPETEEQPTTEAVRSRNRETGSYNNCSCFNR